MKNDDFVKTLAGMQVGEEIGINGDARVTRVPGGFIWDRKAENESISTVFITNKQMGLFAVPVEPDVTRLESLMRAIADFLFRVGPNIETLRDRRSEMTAQVTLSYERLKAAYYREGGKDPGDGE